MKAVELKKKINLSGFFSFENMNLGAQMLLLIFFDNFIFQMTLCHERYQKMFCIIGFYSKYEPFA
jgi:hypothetical protein